MGVTGARFIYEIGVGSGWRVAIIRSVLGAD